MDIRVIFISEMVRGQINKLKTVNTNLNTILCKNVVMVVYKGYSPTIPIFNSMLDGNAQGQHIK